MFVFIYFVVDLYYFVGIGWNKNIVVKIEIFYILFEFLKFLVFKLICIVDYKGIDNFIYMILYKNIYNVL